MRLSVYDVGGDTTRVFCLCFHGGSYEACAFVNVKRRGEASVRPKDGWMDAGARRAAARTMGAADDAVDAEAGTDDARVALTHVDASSYDPVTFAPWEDDDGVAVTRARWLNVFRAATPSFARRAATCGEPDAETRARAFQRAFDAVCDACEGRASDEEPHGGARRACRDAGGAEPRRPWRGANCLELCRARDGILRDACGFADCFASVKREENEAALRALPDVLRALDETTGEDDDARLAACVRGAFAGNIFDLGAAASVDLYENGGGVDFAATVAKLKPRPWCVDDFDAMRERFAKRRHRKAVVFVDNAGADVCLGMIPFARELIRRGTEVVLAANETPSINDITARELRDEIFPALVESSGDAILRDAIADGRLRVVSSGNDMPVIDLRFVSREVRDEAKDADLIVLEGMGRGIETNLYAKLKVDCVKLAMVKHREVAELLGGELYDCVCKFDVGSDDL